jgi:serine/threonine protein kinase
MPSFKSQSDIVYLKKFGKSAIGKGAYGNVCLIQHSKTREGPFALKKMTLPNASEIEYVQQEINLHKKLDNPFIIGLIDFFYEDQTAFIIMEYASSGNLYNYLHKALFIPKPDLLTMFTQIVLAVKHLHFKEILHRDIKPENILLDSNRNVKLCDFGWSAQCSGYQIRNTFCGTPEYMSPEMLLGKGQTHKSDIYSLGNSSKSSNKRCASL